MLPDKGKCTFAYGAFASGARTGKTGRCKRTKTRSYTRTLSLCPCLTFPSSLGFRPPKPSARSTGTSVSSIIVCQPEINKYGEYLFPSSPSPSPFLPPSLPLSLSLSLSRLRAKTDRPWSPARPRTASRSPHTACTRQCTGSHSSTSA